MAGRQEELGRDLARLQAQLRGDTGGHPVQGFLDGIVGGLILGAALALFAARRAAIVEIVPPPEASIELKERATQLAKDAREGASTLADHAGTLTGQAKAALERIVPDDNAPEA